MRSIQRALDLGADGIEIDVQLVGRELVVFHDKRLERTTDGSGFIRRKTFDYVRSLSAGQGAGIPTLREALDLINRRAFVNIELKSARTAVPVAALLAEFTLCGGWKPGDFLVSSFLRKETKQFRAIADASIPVGLLLARRTRFWLRTARLLQASSVHPAARFTTRRLVDEAHRNGLKVFVYTVNTGAVLARMQSLGVDGVFTDYPDRVAPLSYSLG